MEQISNYTDFEFAHIFESKQISYIEEILNFNKFRNLFCYANWTQLNDRTKST
jgi:hypothetical protein